MIAEPGAGEARADFEPLVSIDGDVRYAAEFFARAHADSLLRVLHDELPWQTRSIRLFGRSVESPRLTAFCGEADAAYRYSGTTWTPQPFTPTLQAIRAAIERATAASFNCVLANLYRDGRDSMGWHSDDERELGDNPTIASVSLGAVRKFVLRHRHDPARRVPIELGHGSLLWMAGATQHHWKHALPKTNADIGPRINLTFRRIVRRAARS